MDSAVLSSNWESNMTTTTQMIAALDSETASSESYASKVFETVAGCVVVRRQRPFTANSARRTFRYTFELSGQTISRAKLEQAIAK